VQRKIVFTAIVISFFSQLCGQESDYLLSGKVSYITAQNIYVKFASTEKIHPGDTVFSQVDNKLIPMFIVESISSVSCVGKPLDKMVVKVDDAVAVRIHEKPGPVIQKTAEPPIPKAPAEIKKEAADSTARVEPVKRQQDIRGSLSVSSYTNLSNTAVNDLQRMRYTFSLRANNMGNSRISAESYVSFTHKLNDWAEVQQNVFNALKIYSLALKYDLGAKSSIWAGRKINPNLSNIGAVDGIQAETTVGQFTMGAVAGSRPNDADYNVNFKLLEYGGFVGHTVSNKMGRMQSSLAFFEQRNTGITDRRFVYFQHDNSLLKNLYLFTSCELDLYKVVEGVPKNEPTLTGLYVSLRYRMFKQLSLFASYDARKNVIYYETYKGIADRLLEDATRQGYQLRINYRPWNMVNLGVNASYRFRDKDLNPNETLNGFIAFNQLPWIKVSATLTANLLKTSYLDGQIYGIRLARDIIPGKMFAEVNYRYIDYKFLNSTSTLVQNIAQANISWQLKHKMSFSVDYELTLENVNKYHRIYVSFSKRF
jgi:hypothetical protein